MNYIKTYGEWNKQGALRVFGQNGWDWVGNEDDLSQFKLTVLVDYEVTVTAQTATYSNELCNDGHYGIQWLECTYESNAPYSYEDLEFMQDGICMAEDNLIRNGIPFTPNYKFHGKNAANNARRNTALRKAWNLNEIESKDWAITHGYD